jgi:hypothetical protein
VFNQLEAHFITTKKWANLDRAYVNFTHWAFVKGDHGSIPYQKNGFYVSWLRHNAYICQNCFPSLDLVIPMAFPNMEGVVTPECVSCIVISIKLCKDTEGIRMEGILSKEAVEGVIAVKDNQKKRKLDKAPGEKGSEVEGKRDNKVEGEKDNKIEDEKDNKTNAYYTHGNPSLNVRLTLNAVKFINPGDVASMTDHFERWIEFSEDKPYIAFAMSMENTERKVDLFAAEKVSSHSFLFYVLG